MSRQVVFVTGGTGNLGQFVIRRLLERGDEVVALVRHGKRALLEAQIPPQLKARALVGLRVLEGDIRHPFCGLSQCDIPILTHVAHCAADVRWGADPAILFETNVSGTRNVLDLAHAAGQRRPLQGVVLVSSAYVCGRAVGSGLGPELPSLGFSNAYEATKWLAENLASTDLGCPIRIVRPSTIIGQHESGEILNFSNLYYPMRLLATSNVRMFPGNKDVRLDYIPVDIVAGAVIQSLDGRAGPVAHACAGEAAQSLETFWELACELLHEFAPIARRRQPGRFISVGWLDLAKLLPLGKRARRMFRNLRLYKPYLTLDRTFHTDTPVEPGSSEVHLARSLRFALEVQFRNFEKRKGSYALGQSALDGGDGAGGRRDLAVTYPKREAALRHGAGSLARVGRGATLRGSGISDLL